MLASSASPKEHSGLTGVPRGHLIARNTLLNLAGQGLPFLIGFLAMPSIVRGLGTARFGILGLGWVVVGYFSALDLGMGRAATRFAAYAIGRKSLGEIPGIAWSATAVQAAVGTIGSVTLAVFAPFLVRHVLNVAPGLEAEAETTFRILALAIPIVLISASFRGLLEASQRFDLINLVSIPGSALNFLIPLAGALSGWSLPRIIGWLVLARAVTLLAYFVIDARLFPGLTRPVGKRLAALRQLLSFGLWITVSNIISPLLDQLDRILLGSFAGVESVGYYTAPQEAVLRTRILPAALASTLFPEFTAQGAAGDSARLRRFYGIAVRLLAFLLGPMTLALVLLGPDLLRIWLGGEYARNSSLALRLLAIGSFANALAYVPFSYLHGANRPDVPAKFHALELPFYLLLAWALMPRYGVSGAGATWAIRATADAVLLFQAAAAIGAMTSIRDVSARAWIWAGLLASGLATGFLPVWEGLQVMPRVAVSAVACAFLMALGWATLLQEADRGRIRSVIKRLSPVS